MVAGQMAPVAGSRFMQKESRTCHDALSLLSHGLLVYLF